MRKMGNMCKMCKRRNICIMCKRCKISKICKTLRFVKCVGSRDASASKNHPVWRSNMYTCNSWNIYIWFNDASKLGKVNFCKQYFRMIMALTAVAPLSWSKSQWYHGTIIELKWKQWIFDVVLSLNDDRQSNVTN